MKLASIAAFPAAFTCSGVGKSGSPALKSTTGTATVDYNVFQSDGSTAWPVAGVPGSGTGSDQTLNIVGKLANATEVAAGTYKELLTITLDY